MQGALPAPDEVYEGALTAYMQGNYDLAISGFKTYLTFFPKTLLEDRAQFWLAETHYSMGKYIEAIRQYDLLIGKYPKSRKLPAAYLKKAYAYSEIGEKSRALATLKELRNRFPNTREARLAEPAIMDLE
ncbi:MAG: tol-pal system protein YbgF [Candidatus Methylomirabilia bacterium]